MGVENGLKELLRQKKQESERAAAGVDWEARKAERIAAISALFDDIVRWIKPSADEMLVGISREPCELHDERMGTYQSEKLILEIGYERLEFLPVGERVAGASARVDASCGPYQLTMIHLPGQGWKFLMRGAVVTTIPVTEESFTDALKELLAG